MLLGRVTASGKLTLSLNASSDGSQVPYGICIDDFDATLSDLVGGAYVKGEFDELAVIFGTGQTIANTRAALKDLGIFLKPVVPA